MAILKQRESIKITGTVKIETYRVGYAEIIMPLFDVRKMVRKEPDSSRKSRHMEILDETIRTVKADHFIRTALECPNTVMDSPNHGIDLIIQALIGMDTYTLSLDYIEIGTGQTTPAITDTALTTPTNRALIGFQQDYGTTDAIVQTIFSDSQLTNGTYYEMGTFCGGTSTIGSGQLFNHALFASPYVKVSGQNSSIQVDFAIS